MPTSRCFLLHLLEFMGVDYAVDVDEINERWRELAAVDVWAQLIMKEPNNSIERILAAPQTGTYRLDEDGNLIFVRVSNDWHEVQLRPRSRPSTRPIGPRTLRASAGPVSPAR
jgi:hypothetical protein